MRQRDNFVDVAKEIGILLIVCIHTEVFGVIGKPLTFIAVTVFPSFLVVFCKMRKIQLAFSYWANFRL